MDRPRDTSFHGRIVQGMHRQGRIIQELSFGGHTDLDNSTPFPLYPLEAHVLVLQFRNHARFVTIKYGLYAPGTRQFKQAGIKVIKEKYFFVEAQFNYIYVVRNLLWHQ
jgi:hypothetical protein